MSEIRVIFPRFPSQWQSCSVAYLHVAAHARLACTSHPSGGCGPVDHFELIIGNAHMPSAIAPPHRENATTSDRLAAQPPLDQPMAGRRDTEPIWHPAVDKPQPACLDWSLVGAIDLNMETLLVRQQLV